MNYDHIRNALPPEGSDNLEFTVDLGGFRPSGGGSGRVPPGLYQVRSEDARFVRSKSGSGVNLHMKFRVETPENYRGIPVQHWIALPVSGLSQDQIEMRERNMQQLIASAASGTPGALEKLVNQAPGGAGKRVLTPAALKDQTFWVRLEDDEYNGRVSSKIRYFTTKEEYDARPGPDPDGSRPTATITDAVTNLADLGSGRTTKETTVANATTPADGNSEAIKGMLF